MSATTTRDAKAEPLPHRSAPATGVAHTLHRDHETRSANLPKVGVDRYAADPSTEALCAAYVRHRRGAE